MDILKKYVNSFNEADEECYKNDIDNAHAYEWLNGRVPYFECPDKEFEKTYYFRWWTFRKHIRSTPDGYVVTEFLPKVPWSNPNNAISAPVGHHLFEARWIKNSKEFIKDYILYFLENPASSHHYSTWTCYAIYKYAKTIGDFDFGENFIEKLCDYYEEWEKIRGLDMGMLWSFDGEDAMEISISGTTPDFVRHPGVRPTLNSYMCADAWAIAEFAKIYGRTDIVSKYTAKYEALKSKINENLYENGFYRAFHYNEGEDISNLFEKHANESPRESIGYIPWMFGIPPKGREDAFRLLEDKNVFYSDFGHTSAERCHPRFLYEHKHECLWNGYVWPFSISQTLTALLNVINSYGREDFKPIFTNLLTRYAYSHHIICEDGSVRPWIDEVRHPDIDDWTSRTILKNNGWLPGKGGYERGKDYNHSTFCDLVITGIVGVEPDAHTLTVRPNIPENWDYFKLSGLFFKGKTYTVVYDKTGNRYGLGTGVKIIEE